MYQMDTKELRLMHFTHLGVIFSNISVLGLVIVLAGILSEIFIGFYFLVLIIITLATLFLLLASPEFRALYTVNNEAFNRFTEVMTYVSMGIAPVAIVTSTLAIVFLSLNKKDPHKGRVAFSCVMLALTVAATVALFIVKGGELF